MSSWDGAGSIADSASSWDGAGSGADSASSWDGAGSGADSAGPWDGAGSSVAPTVKGEPLSLIHFQAGIIPETVRQTPRDAGMMSAVH